MFCHRLAVALAATATLAACERAGEPSPAPGEQLATLAATQRPGPLRVADSGMAVEAPSGLAVGDGLRPAPGPVGLRP